MAQEIERKFLVCGEFKQFAKESMHIMQGYLCSAPERTVRIRVNGDKAYITIKGAGNESGVSRFEWEKEIPIKEAKELLSICEPGVIDKTRYLVDYKNHTFEVDEFYGDNKGLIIAELELRSEDEVFEKPEWLGKEVTGRTEFYNAMLVKKPFKLWAKTVLDKD